MEFSLEDVRAVVKEMGDDLKAYMKETTVCVKHCSERHGDVGVEIKRLEDIITENKNRQDHDYKNLRFIISSLVIVVALILCVYGWMNGFYGGVTAPNPALDSLVVTVQELVKNLK